MSVAPHQPSQRTIVLVLAGVLLLTLAFEFPGVMDFQKFGFYDQGAWLRLDQLYAGGRLPTVDLGYSYGMLPLILSRGWFAVFGRTPWAYLGFLTLCNLFSVWAIGVVLHRAGTSWRRLGAACVLLPLAVFPDNYSLMHPLEMALILWALVNQLRGRYALALVCAVAAAFTKPSMAYVLGLMLLLFGLFGQPASARVRGLAAPRLPLRRRLAVNGSMVVAPIGAAVLLVLVSLAAVGVRPALANILPLTGGRSYRQMNFGIFHAGRAFWLFGDDGNGLAIARHYLLTPALFWILASLLVWALGLRAGYRLWRGRSVGEHAPRNTDPLVVMLAAMHAAFVFVFYAWAGSWTYYAYLPVLGLLVGLRGRRQTIMLRVLLVIGACGLSEQFGSAYGRWWGMSRVAADGGLFVDRDLAREAAEVRAIARGHRTLYLVNGALPLLWPEAQTPEVWFLSPGIPTPAEIQRVRQQMDAADVIVLCKDYDQKQEAWFWPEFAEQRKAFALPAVWGFRGRPLFDGRHFLVLQRQAAN